MSRTIPTGLLTKMNSSEITDLFFAVEMFFDSGTLRVWSGVGNKTIGGNTFTGTGALLSVSGMEESSDMAFNGASVTLSGVDSSLISAALTEPYQNRICKIYFGSDSDVLELYQGYMDVMMIEDSGETSTITMNIEGRLIVLERVVVRRYTQESQVSRYPSDTFFSYTADLADKPVIWGRST